MRLKTFTAPDMNRAMLMIRETMGEDAVIISTARDGNGKSVSVTAAVDDGPVASHEPGGWDDYWDNAAASEEAEPEEEYPAGGLGQYLAAQAARRKTANSNARPPEAARAPQKKPLMTHDAILSNRELAYILNELEQVLTFHSLPSEMVERIIRTARLMENRFPADLEGVQQALEELIGQICHFEPLDLHKAAANGKAPRIMLVGPPGTGKTLAVAKIAADLVADGAPIHVITIDNKRAGSVEQLRAFTHIMGLETEVADSRTELRGLLKECPPEVPVVIDTFGTNPYSFAELKELTDFANLHEVEPVLVLSAGGDAQEAADVAQAFAFLGIRRLLVTRTDAARRLGAVLSAVESSGFALCNATTSPQVAGGYIRLDAGILSALLLKHKTDH